MKRIIENILYDIEEKNKDENGCEYEITLEIPMSYGWIDNVNFIIREKNENILFPLSYNNSKDDKAVFKGNIYLPTKALYNYFLSFKGNDKIYNVTKNHVRTDFNLSDGFKLSVNFGVPKWAQGKIMYQIFIDRFARGSEEELPEMPRRIIHKSWNENLKDRPGDDGIWNNDFFGGDLKGITKNLDYIESLGVEILYLSPIVYSQSNHRYDASDYEQIDPYAGTKDDLKELCEEAHKRGMKVILDAAFDHTGNDSKYFNQYNTFNTIGAYQSQDSLYMPMYRYKIKNGKPVFDYWWNQKNMPQCNCDSEKWQEYITGKGGIIDQWFSLGIDGLRLDVADELSDYYIELIRKAVKRNKSDGFIIGEVWENPMRKNRNFLSSGKGMDTTMNYYSMSSLIKYFRYGEIEELKNRIKEIQYEYPEETINALMNFTSTHDMTRGINLWDDQIFEYNGEWPWDLISKDYDFSKNYKLGDKYQQAKEIFMAYAYTLTFLPGTLSIFSGDEVGLEGIGNLNNRKPFPWDKIDKELLNFFQTIGTIRKKEPFMEQAELRIIDINPNYFSFERLNDKEKLFVLVNRTENEKKFSVPKEYENLESTYTLRKVKKYVIGPYGGIAIKKKE